MKRLKFFPIIFLILITTSVEANDGHGCLAQSAGLENQERSAFLTRCLTEISKPENVYVEAMRHKLQRCDRNANNRELKDQARGDYIYACLNNNDAAQKVASTRKSTKLASRTVPHMD
jgi:hypothetical protein